MVRVGNISYERKPWTDPSGKVHDVSTSTCLDCNKIIAQGHHSCCGHSYSGWGAPCNCANTTTQSPWGPPPDDMA